MAARTSRTPSGCGSNVGSGLGNPYGQPYRAFESRLLRQAVAGNLSKEMTPTDPKSRRTTSFPSRLVDRLLRPAFGDDVFISYSRSDGATYAAGLASQLADEEFSCRIDQWGAQVDDKLPKPLLHALRRSAILVLVGTAGAAKSNHVADEIVEFRRTGRSIVPIVFDGVRLKNGIVRDGAFHATPSEPDDLAFWAKDVVGLPLEVEPIATLDSGTPSERVLNRIRKTFIYKKKDARLRKAARLLLIVFAALATAAGIAALIASDKAADAVKATKQAKDADAEAKRQMQRAADAEKLTNEKTTQLTNVSRQLQAAQGKLTEAQTTNLGLETQRQLLQTSLTGVKQDLRNVQELERTARIGQQQAEAARLRAIASALSAGAAAIEASRGNIGEMKVAVAETLENYVRLQPRASDIPGSLHLALTDAIVQSRQLGRRFGADFYPRVHEVAASPAGVLIAGAGAARLTGDLQKQHAVMLWNLATGEAIHEIPSDVEPTSCALSRDLTRLVAGYKNGDVTLYARQNGAWRQVWTRRFAPPITAVRFTPNQTRVMAMEGVNVFLLDARTGEPTQVKWPPRILQFVMQTQLKGFNLLDQWPPILGTWWVGFDAKERKRRTMLTTVRTDTGEMRTIDFEEPRIRRLTGTKGISTSSIPAIDPTGRWLAAVRSINDAFQDHTYLIDLTCVANAERACTPVHVLADPQARRSDDIEVAFSPDGEYLVMSAAHDKLHVWRLNAVERGDTRPASIPVERGVPHIKGFTVAGDGVILLVSDDVIAGNRLNAEVQAWSLSSPRLKAKHSIAFDKYDGFYPQSMHISQASHGAFLVISGKTGGGTFSTRLMVSERGTAGGRVLLRHDIILGPATSVAASPDGELGAVVHSGGEIAIWKLSGPELLTVLSGFRNGVADVEWARSNGQSVLYAASNEGQLVRWAGTEDYIDTPSSSRAISDLLVSADGRVMAMHSRSGTLGVWRGGRWSEIAVGVNRAIALSASGDRYAVEAANGGVEIFELDGTLRAALQPSVLPFNLERIHFTLSDTRVIGEGTGGQADMILWDVEGGAPLYDPARQRATNRLPDRTDENPEMLWAVQTHSSTDLIDLRTGRKIASIHDPRAAHDGVPPSGRTLFDFSAPSGLGVAASASRQSLEEHVTLAHVWNLRSGESRAFVPVSADARVDFVQNGRAMLVLSPESVPTLVPLEIEGKFRELCFLVDDLSPNEKHPAAVRFCSSN